MKTRTGLLMLAGTLGLLLLLFGGCYTQLSTVRNDSGGDEQYAPQQYQDDTSYVSQDQGDYDRDQNGYYQNDDWNCRPHVGFSYYYPAYYWPSFAFSAAYYDPWFYDSYWGGYYPGYYYPGYYYGYGSPYYYGYSPWYYHYPYYGNNYGGYAGIYHRGSRDFGSTRGGAVRGAGDVRTAQPSNGGGGFTLPTAGRLDRSSGGSAGGRTPAVTNTGRRPSGNQRSYAPRTNRAPNVDRGAANRGTGTRGEVRRSPSPPQYHPRGTYAPSPSPGRSVAPAPGRSGNRDAGSSRGYAPSRSPASSPAPARSAPAPSGGGRSGNPRGRG